MSLSLPYEMKVFFLLMLLLAYGNASITEDNGDYPPMWDFVPSSINHFKVENGKAIIDPWNYLERMGMYKILLNLTAPFLDMERQGNKKNMLWGLPLQHGWQFHTGRLGDDSEKVTYRPSKEGQTCISGRSWWACMNYYLSAVPFFGAMDAGLVQSSYDLHILHPKDMEEDFCYSVAGCRSAAPRAMDGWKAFFEAIKTSRQASDNSVPRSPSRENELLSHMWRAHVESIQAGLPRCSNRLHYLSEPERNFGLDWATAVEFIAATNFPTDFQNTNEFQIFLPHRMLADGDKAPYITDFTEQENRVLSVLHLINKVDSYTGGRLLTLWNKVMCSDQARAEGQNVLRHVINDPLLLPQTVFNIFKELIMNPACRLWFRHAQ